MPAAPPPPDVMLVVLVPAAGRVPLRRLPPKNELEAAIELDLHEENKEEDK